jgi:hypothetical protein
LQKLPWRFPAKTERSRANQRAALPRVIARCVEAHPACGIRLQGSVARGDERVDSDIDMTVVVPGDALLRDNELLSTGNHWSMRLVQDETTGVTLNINWVCADELLELVKHRGAAAWYMFLKGSTLRDPAGSQPAFLRHLESEALLDKRRGST